MIANHQGTNAAILNAYFLCVGLQRWRNLALIRLRRPVIGGGTRQQSRQNVYKLLL
jgi:hypothetical protein